MDKTLNTFYSFAFDYLKEQTQPLIDEGKLTEQELLEYTTKTDVPNTDYTLRDAFRMLIICLQDYQSMPNVINYIAREQKVNEILFNLDCNQIVENWTGETLYHRFCEEFPVSNADSPRNSWLKFSKGIISAAHFMVKFRTIEEFKSFLNCFSYNEHTREALPLLLSAKIFGIQFALACNWIKELGLIDYPKPDIHMIKVFHALGVCREDQIECYRAMVKIAEECSVSPYQLDKVIWLICSGNYYRQGVSLTGKNFRDRFIAEIEKYNWK